MYFTKEEFINNQPVISKYFSNAIKNNRVPQAILLYGELNSPLYEVGMYLAQSISCEENDLACNNCPSCVRFINGTHPDFIYLSGKDQTIKKQDILTIEDFYSLSNLEQGHKSVYIIHLIENATNEAVNALLKFLEEPKGDVVAILTTNNRSKVLPTILSRCQIFSVLNQDVNKLVSNYTGDISLDRYYVLSYLTYLEKDKEEINQSKEFDLAFNGVSLYLASLIDSPYQASLVLFKDFYDKQKQVSKSSNFNSNKCYNYFYSILHVVFNDILTKNTSSMFINFVNDLQEYKINIIKASEYIQDMSNKISANLNFCFILARLAQIMEE
jgi:DNA polymerase III subunit delta'